MAIKIQANTEALLDAIRSNSRHHVGVLKIQVPPLDYIDSSLVSRNTDFSLTTDLYPTGAYGTMGNKKTTLPTALSQSLHPSYNFLVNNKAQVIVQRDGRQYAISLKAHIPGWSLETSQRTGDKKSLEVTLEEYGEVFSAFTNCLYRQESNHDAPDFIYFLGNNLDLPKKPEDIFNKLFGEASKKDTLDELESKILVPNPQVGFDQIGGCHQGKQDIMRVYYDIRQPEVALYFGRDPSQSKGVLIVGRSGSGKTLLVKALATKLIGELDEKLKFYAVNYEDITSIYRGGEAQGTGRLFQLAERNEKDGFSTLMFLDEIHVVGERKREHNEGLDTLLPHLDGIRTRPGLVVIGATYRPIELLDPALVRRFGTKIIIPDPNAEERKEIFEIYLKKRQELAARAGNPNLFGDIDLDQLVDATSAENGNPGFNGSNIAGLVARSVEVAENNAREIAGKDATPKQVMGTFEPISTESILKIIGNYPRIAKDKEGNPTKLPILSTQIIES